MFNKNQTHGGTQIVLQTGRTNLSKKHYNHNT